MTDLILALILSGAAHCLLGSRKFGHISFRRQFAFWLITLSILTRFVKEQGWPGLLVVLLILDAGCAILMLSCAAWAPRAIGRFRAMPPEQRDQILAKVSPFVRERIAKGLGEDIA